MTKRDRLSSTHPSSIPPDQKEHGVITASADLREGWDVESWSQEFVTWVRQQPWYRPDLLYTGFDADDIGKRDASTWGGGLIFCASEQDILSDERKNNPIDYAHEYPRAAIAVYDPQKMEVQSVRAYKMKDPSARIALVQLTLE